ncbi:MAG: GTPase HflX, partial [Beijerinckiaceae bacterium]
MPPQEHIGQGIDFQRTGRRGNRAYVVGPYLSARAKPASGRAAAAERSPEARLSEATGLAAAIDL